MDRARIGDLKLHLRKEPDDTGILVVNASAALFLDRVARAYFDAFMSELETAARNDRVQELGDPSTAGALLSPGVVRRVRRGFRVAAETARADWSRLWGSVLSVATGGSCPFSDFEVRRVDPLSKELSASSWKTVIRKLADWGVPTLVFTGGEPLL